MMTSSSEIDTFSVLPLERPSLLSVEIHSFYTCQIIHSEKTKILLFHNFPQVEVYAHSLTLSFIHSALQTVGSFLGDFYSDEIFQLDIRYCGFGCFFIVLSGKFAFQ